jgi:hypothetical protein
LKRVASWVAWVEVGERARRRLEGGGRIEVDMVVVGFGSLFGVGGGLGVMGLVSVVGLRGWSWG